jgi:hypothetical protein
VSPALAAALALALAGAAGEGRGAGVPPRGTVLELENAARGRALAIALAPGEGFAVVSQHSMYDAPVTEHFVVGTDGRIMLRMVSSPSAAVREYFGITAIGERHPVVRSMPEVVFRVAAGTPQRLRVGDDERSFRTLGAPGDRVLMRAACRPGLACALLSRFTGSDRDDSR